MPGFDNDVCYFGAGIDTRGVTPIANQMTTDGQLLIASTAAPHIKVGSITSSDSSITITPGSGTISLSSALGVGRYPITPYVVGPVGKAGYQTIQTALNAANAAGVGIVYVQPGVYTENLTLYSDTQVVGVPGTAGLPGIVSIVQIAGTHTPPATGNFSFSNVLLTSAADIFNSAIAGTGRLLLDHCHVRVVDGYAFNLPNWVGQLAKTQVEDSSGDNGIVTNTGGASIYFQNCNTGTTDTNIMTTSGLVTIKKCELKAPWSAQSGTVATMDRTTFNIDINFFGNSSGTFTFCRISSEDRAAYTHIN